MGPYSFRACLVAQMQVEVAQEGEGMMKGGIIAGGAAAAFALAGLIVANLPDVDAL